MFPESDRGLFKAVINGYNVDTRQFVRAEESQESREKTEAEQQVVVIEI